MSENKMEYKLTVPAAEAGSHLEYMGKGLIEGTLKLNLGGITLPMKSGPEVKLELKAKSDGGKHKLELFLSWEEEQPLSEATENKATEKKTKEKKVKDTKK